MGRRQQSLPTAAGDRERDAARRRRDGVESTGVLQRRVPFQQPGAAPIGDRRLGRDHRPALVARRGSGNRARHRGHLELPRGRQLRQAPAQGHRQLPGARDGTDRPDPCQPLRTGPGRELLQRVRASGREQPGLVRARVPRPARALFDLYPQGPHAAGRLGADVAAALAVGQLQPVHEHPQSVPVRQPAGAFDRDHPRGSGARPVLPGPRRRRCVRGLGCGRAPLPPQPRLHRRHGLLDGWHGDLQARRAVPGSVRARPAHRRIRAQHRRARVDARPAGADVERHCRRARQRHRLHARPR